MRKTPYTNSELFDAVNKILKENNLLPTILDYGLSAYSKEPITSYTFEPIVKLDYGGNEGIYLDIAITGRFDDSHKIISLGTYKTLDESDDAMHAMAILEADFIIALHKLVAENMIDFTWSGYDIFPIDENGERMKHSCGYEVQNSAKVMKYVNQMFSAGCKAVRVIDNATKSTTDYTNEQKN